MIESKKPRLVKLVIKNFRCIGNVPVEIELDDIVVLVGPNNSGKSTILRAYEIAMSEGSKKGELSINDFPNSCICDNNLPEIELHTIVYDNSPGDKWIIAQTNDENLVKEKWVWSACGKPKRYGYLSTENRWATDEDKEKVPWGAPNVANSRRPEAHLVSAFDPPEKQAEQITDLLVTILKNNIEKVQNVNEEKTAYHTLLDNIKELQKSIVKESEEQIKEIQTKLSKYVGKVFVDYEVLFDAKPETDIEKAISLFKSTPDLLMGPRYGYKSPINLQGSGARRTLLWTAIKIITENDDKKKSERPNVLLIDEPEICLHPNAVREARELLYDLPIKDNWQVITTTHSPQFIDISKDNTTIIRVSKLDNGDVIGTTLFRPERAQLTIDDKENLKLLNIFDPYVAEFFFGGKVIIVEGDTEYSAFNYIKSFDPQKYSDIHIIRARGKATIVSLVKILNQFGTPYSVLHDSDSPTIIKKIKGKNTEIANGAWTNNVKILNEIMKSAGEFRLVASVPNFEGAYYGKEVSSEKPYNAVSRLQEDTKIFNNVKTLFEYLLKISDELPQNAIEWKNIDELEDKYKSLKVN